MRSLVSLTSGRSYDQAVVIWDVVWVERTGGVGWGGVGVECSIMGCIGIIAVWVAGNI